MDDFAKRAFLEAEAASADDEFKAYNERIIEHSDIVMMSVCLSVGIDKASDMLEAVQKAGLEETLLKYTRELAVLAFHLGYKEGRLSR